MVEHEFGGEWTEVKLQRLREYLKSYRQIFTKNARASWFKTWYVDAFAGTGTRRVSEARNWDLDEAISEQAGITAYLDGSARTALGLESPFDHYLFIEKSRSRSEQLRRQIQVDFSALLD